MCGPFPVDRRLTNFDKGECLTIYAACIVGRYAQECAPLDQSVSTSMPATTPPIEELFEFLQTAFDAVRTAHRAAHALPFTYCVVYSPILCISP